MSSVVEWCVLSPSICDCLYISNLYNTMSRLAKSHQANTQPPAVPNPNKCVKTNSTNNCAPKLKQSSEPVYQHKNGSVTSKCLQVPDYDLKYTAGGSGGQYTVIPHLKHNPNPMRYSTGSISNNGNIAHGPYASSGDGVNPPGDPHAKFLANGHGLVGVAGLSNAMVRTYLVGHIL